MQRYRTQLRTVLCTLCCLCLLTPMVVQTVQASSHREAPLITKDPAADNTDVYAFVSPDKPDTVTLIASFIPFEEPAGGPNFFSFDDDVHYAIHIDNDGDAEADITYVFEFETEIVNPNTFLYNTGPIESLSDQDWNIRQTYDILQISNGTTQVIGSDLIVPPVNVGPKSTPNYASLSNAAIATISNGIRAFAGQTDDAFFVELGGIFDLLTIRILPGNTGGGVDGLKGYNVNSVALQVPKSRLSNNGLTPTNITDSNAVIGVWSTANRRRTRVLNTDGSAPDTSGEYVQVSRLGAPLVNEVVIPLKDKNKWNASKPTDDGQFANYVTNPELGGLLNALYGVEVPPQGDFGSSDQRDDLIAIFLTGIEGLNQPANVTPSEQLRLNMAVAPSDNPNSLGVVGGDNAGYPNGRRLADDVTDISLKAVAGAAYPLFHPEFEPDPLAAQLGDGVDRNDVSFRSTFPYLALPHQGFDSRPHGIAGTSSGRESELDARERALDQREIALNQREDSLSDSQNQPVTSFSDLQFYPYRGAIEFLAKLGVVNGYTDGTYRPYTKINRAEFVKIMLSAAYNDSQITGSSCFTDVRGDAWYERYVCFASNLGIVTGYPDRLFRPSNTITVEEAYKVITETFYRSDMKGRTNPWYLEYVNVARSRGFYISDVQVGQEVDRGQMARILALALGYR